MGCDYLNLHKEGKFHKSSSPFKCSKCPDYLEALNSIIRSFLTYSTFIILVVLANKMIIIHKQQGRIIILSLIKGLLVLFDIFERIIDVSSPDPLTAFFVVDAPSSFLNQIFTTLMSLFQNRDNIYPFTNLIPCVLFWAPHPLNFFSLVFTEVTFEVFYTILVIFLIILANWWAYQKRGTFWTNAFTDLIVFYYLIVPFIVGNATKFIMEMEISKSPDVSISIGLPFADTQKDKNSLFFFRVYGWLLLVLCFSIPLVILAHMLGILLKLRRSRIPYSSTLKYFSRVYSFLTSDFKDNAFFYEIFRIFLLRISLPLASSLYSYRRLSLILLDLLMKAYIICSVVIKPFLSESLNWFDFISGVFVGTTILICNSIETSISQDFTTDTGQRWISNWTFTVIMVAQISIFVFIFVKYVFLMGLRDFQVLTGTRKTTMEQQRLKKFIIQRQHSVNSFGSNASQPNSDDD